MPKPGRKNCGLFAEFDTGKPIFYARAVPVFRLQTSKLTIIMKMHLWFFSALIASVLALTACSKSGGSVDAGPVEKSFAAAEPALKAAADKAVTAIKSADYSAATAELQKLAANVKLTDEQKKAINDVIAQVQKAVAEMGTKAAGEAGKALGDAQKALGK